MPERLERHRRQAAIVARPAGQASLPGVGRIALALATGAAVALCAAPAAAHGFGQRFDLPLPLSFWVTGAGLSIVLSFVVMAIFVREGAGERDYPRYDLLRLALFRAIAHPVVIAVIRVLAVVVFLAGCAYFRRVEDSFADIL